MAPTALLARLLVAGLAIAGVLAVACGSEGVRGDDDGNLEPSAPNPEVTTADLFEQRFGASWPQTDFTKFSIEISEIVSGGPGKDGIPAIDEPVFVDAEEASTFVADREPVIALEVGGEARAYPLQVLIWHEIVNDTIGGVPVAVTYCPLCNSAIAFEREVDGRVYDFGVSGLLRNSDLIMYDRQTESWWQQLTGEAIVGTLLETKLVALAASTVSFEDFRSSYPDGLVLSRDTGFDRPYGQNPYAGYDTSNSPFLFRGELDERLPAAERVVAVELDGETVAYPFSALADELVVRDTVGTTEIVVFFQPGTTSALDDVQIDASRDVGASGVFEPVADGRALTFRADDGEIRDNQTDSTWNVLGRATGGPLRGSRLTPVVHGDHFWFAWVVFQPDTRIWTP